MQERAATGEARHRLRLLAVLAGTVTVIAMPVLSEVSGVLADMHPLSRVGNGGMDIVGNRDRARNAVESWQTVVRGSGGAARPSITPRAVALW